MRIREIELVGFKSFREPIRLTLAGGLNAIVGPNGCGKSNVSDAIRWVLGEQSARHLRVDSMEDVIFCGNHRSPPLNFAEVSLTFEQADGAALGLTEGDDGLAARIARLPEFTVTRRLFRSGESHYLVNGTPARLRDITEIFLGSGVGPKAYAMIEQGRVGQIVAAKPEEMRLFIEEAAGTTRFRSRKIAAERKLVRTQDNLARVQDVLREIERQLGHLRRQARKAEEFKLLEADLQREEHALAAHRWGEFESEARRLCETMREAALALTEIQDRHQSAVQGRDVASAEHRRAAEETERAVQALGEAAATVARLLERSQALVRMSGDLAVRDERLEIEDREVAERLMGLADELGTAEMALQEARLRLAGCEAQLAVSEQEWRSALTQAEAEESAYAEDQKAVDRLRVDGIATSARRVDLSARAEGLEVEYGRVVARQADLVTDQTQTVERELQAAIRETEARATHGALEEDRRHASAEVKTVEEEARRCEEERRDRRETLRHLQGRVDALRDRETALEGYGEGVTSALVAEQPPIGLIVDGLDIPAELERAVAAALGDALRGAIVSSREHAVSLVDWVRTRGQGRVACIPLEEGSTVLQGEAPAPGPRLAAFVRDRPGFDGLAERLLRRVLLANTLDEAVRLRALAGAAWIWVTPEGDLVDQDGLVTGGHEPVNTGLLERRREISEIDSAIDAEAQAVALCSERLEQLRGACADAGERLGGLDRRAHEATLGLVAAEHERDAAVRDRSLAERRLEEGRREVEERAQRLGTARTNLDVAQRDAAEATVRLTTQEAVFRQRQAALDGIRERARSARESREQQREAAASARDLVTGQTSVLARLGHEQGEAGRRAHGVAFERDELRRAMTQVGEEMQEVRGHEAEARAELTRFEDEVARLRREAAEATDAVARIERECTAFAVELTSAEDTRRSLEVARAANEAQRAALTDSVEERFGTDVATFERIEDWLADGATERIRSLRERIGRLGDVNVTAIADVRELEERQSFLDSQKSDLETSIEDLRRTIADLSKATKVRFRETFDKANERFQETFRELFRGGHAELKLTNPANILESGIEIEVQPPGKQVRSLAMLSGGEKALTAVSLIMALFSLRPTPFCLLDEVDAPLDDANVGRFNAMLQKMCVSTQFIVITHKQRTMESAHALYGVTMPEAGVSQVVSVDLQQGEEFAQAASA